MKKFVYISTVVLALLSCSNKNQITPRNPVYNIKDTTLSIISGNGSMDVADDVPIENISASKVGIAFGGGGAKAVAEIGALKVIEEAGIKPGYIAGSSMGAVVCGLYAAGYSAKELDSLFLTEEWLSLFEKNEIGVTSSQFRTVFGLVKGEIFEKKLSEVL